MVYVCEPAWAAPSDGPDADASLLFAPESGCKGEESPAGGPVEVEGLVDPDTGEHESRRGCRLRRCRGLSRRGRLGGACRLSRR